MCSFVYGGNENGENGLNRFFFEKKDYLPFSFVQLVMVPVHSSLCFCTLPPFSAHMLLCFSTFGLSFCSFGFYVHLPIFYVHLVPLFSHLPYSIVQMDVV